MVSTELKVDAISIADCYAWNLEIATKKTKVFGFVGTGHLRTKIIINDETLEQVNQFTYLGCNKLTNFLMMLNLKWQNFYNYWHY